MVLKNLKLKYLDERPITAEERRLNDAWGIDGRDGEMSERRKIADEKKEATQVYFS